MTQFWNMDIDGLERRAFVSSGVEDWLTAACADWGEVWKNGSGRGTAGACAGGLGCHFASGSADYYDAWCGRVEDILRVKMLPLARGNGTVDIVAVGFDGKAPRQAVIVEVQAIVDKERPMGGDAKVIAATEMAVNVAASATLMDGGDLETVKTSFTGVLADFSRNTALRTNVVSHAKADAMADKIAQVCFFAADEGLSLWERDYGLPVREGASLEDRRAVVRAAMAGDGS